MQPLALAFIAHSMASRRSDSCGAAVMGCSSLLRLLAVLLAAAALPRAAAVKGLSDWNTGLITHFGGAQDGERGAWAVWVWLGGQ